MDIFRIFIALILLFLIIVNASARDVYHCINEKGEKSFQDEPCEDKTVKIEKPKSADSERYREEITKQLARISGKTEEELKDPKMREAVEALVVADAGKAYAFTQIYDISAQFCGSTVRNALDNYKKSAAETIALGKYYYTVGFDLKVGDKHLKKSGQELTSALNTMLSNLKKEHQSASKSQLKYKCREAQQALKSLSLVYGS